jgi:serine/threonine-protein kinase
MAEESRVMQLLQEILESDCTPEDACSDSPELLFEVRERLLRVRKAEEQIEAMFPSGSMAGASVDLRNVAIGRLPHVVGYEVERILGRGGMGVVYKARHLKLGRTVALKMMLSGRYAGGRELSRFLREAGAVAALRHEHIVHVYDAGEVDGCPYFTMEYVEGGTLAQRLGGAPQPTVQAAVLVARLAAAVHVAHRAGILHRDLKPSNILLTGDGTPKITDFGLARRMDGEPTLTLSGGRMGTPSYMAPEQVIGKLGTLGPAVDIYALGGIFYEMLTGRPPFRGESAADTERQVLAQEPVPPSRFNLKIRRDVDTICLKCLQKEPSRRYATAADLAADLERFLGGKPITARPVGAAERAVKWARRRPAIASLVITILLALTAAIGAGARIQRQESTRRTELALREGTARQAIETAITVSGELGRSERWVEAQHIIRDAGTRLAEANSPQLRERFARAAEDLHNAQELEEIRQSYAEPNTQGYNFNPAAAAYSKLFQRIGIGPEVPLARAAALVHASPIRDQLIVGLENAAFVTRVLRGPEDADLQRLLAIARLADPDPSWKDRFRDPTVWRDRESLLKLVDDAHSAALAPAAHQLVIIGVLLNGAGAPEDTVKVLREAQHRNMGDFWLNLELGNALARVDQPAEACQFYRAALAVRPNNYVLLTTLGVSLQNAGQNEEGIAALRVAIDENRKFPSAWYNLINGLCLAARWDEAQTARQAALRMNPTLADFLPAPHELYILAKARALAGKQDWNAAAKVYAEAAEVKSTADSEGSFEYAAVQLLSGDRDAYRQITERMLRQRGVRPFLAARACTLAPCTAENLALAGQLSANELGQAESEHWSLTERGALCYRSGRFDEAIPLLARSIAADDKPGAAVMNWLWLAMAHERLGHTDEARRWFKKATSWLAQFDDEIPQNSKTLSFHLHNWLEAQVLRREAAEAISR